MKRSKELIEKYKRYIDDAEKELDNTTDAFKRSYLQGKITAYKFFLIDLQE